MSVASAPVAQLGISEQAGAAAGKKPPPSRSLIARADPTVIPEAR